MLYCKSFELSLIHLPGHLSAPIYLVTCLHPSTCLPSVLLVCLNLIILLLLILYTSVHTYLVLFRVLSSHFLCVGSVCVFVGKMFRSEMLPKFVTFVLMFYKHKPVDWLLDNYFWVQECQGVSRLLPYSFSERNSNPENC